MASSKTDIQVDETSARHTRTTADGVGERVDLPITGMTCAACARRIERKLNKTPGVNRAGVNFFDTAGGSCGIVTIRNPVRDDVTMAHP